MNEKENPNTSTMLSELKSVKDINGFIDKNENNFLSHDLPVFLENMLTKYKVSKNEAISGADLDRSYGYQIFKGTRYTSRNNYLRLAIAIGMDLEDTQRLLTVTNTGPLYVKVKQDAAVIFCIERHINLKETQELLYSLDLGLL